MKTAFILLQLCYLTQVFVTTLASANSHCFNVYVLLIFAFKEELKVCAFLSEYMKTSSVSSLFKKTPLVFTLTLPLSACFWSGVDLWLDKLEFQ